MSPDAESPDPDFALLVDAATVRAVREELRYVLGPVAEDRIRVPLSDEDSRVAFDELLGRGRAREAREAWARLNAALLTAASEALTA